MDFSLCDTHNQKPKSDCSDRATGGEVKSRVGFLFEMARESAPTSELSSSQMRLLRALLGFGRS